MFKDLFVYWHYFLVDDYKRMKLLFKEIKKDPAIIHHESKVIDLLKLTPKLLQRYNKFLQLYTPELIREELLQSSITPIHIFDERYPKQLKEIYDPPFVLYSIGNLKLLKQNKLLGIVGTRFPTSYGEAAVKKIIEELSGLGYITVSGMAKGIDCLVHETSILHSISTVGVLGSGFHHFYPQESLKVAQQMMDEHLLLTEYPPMYPPRHWYFPKRNRIISGLSKGVLVIEAKKKSGSLITADQALEQGREVFACPGSIFSKESEGTNYLIYQGAKIITSVNEIMEEF